MLHQSFDDDWGLLWIILCIIYLNFSLRTQRFYKSHVQMRYLRMVNYFCGGSFVWSLWTIPYFFDGDFVYYDERFIMSSKEFFSDHWTIRHFFFDEDFIDQLGWFIIFWVEIWLITYGCSSVLWRRFADHHRWFYHHSSMELSPSIVNDESSFLCWFLLLLMITVDTSSVFWWGFYQ